MPLSTLEIWVLWTQFVIANESGMFWGESLWHVIEQTCCDWQTWKEKQSTA